MRNQTILLLILLILCGTLFYTQKFARPGRPASDIPATDTPFVLTGTTSGLPTGQDIFFSNIPVFTGPLPKLSGKSDDQTLGEQILIKQLPRLLEDKEGQYTNLNELLNDDGTSSLSVRSDWVTRYLYPEMNLPNLSIRLGKDTETGEYEPVGGALTLPGGAWEAGYEINSERGENKATLQWKKSF